MRGVFRLAVPSLLMSGVAVAQSGLPVAAEQVLEARYPGWRFAELDPHLAHDLVRGQSAAWGAADFDGDGRRDYAVQLVAPAAPPDSAQQRVALLPRRGGYEPVVIMAGGLRTAVYLGREPKGGMVVDLEQYDDRHEPSAANGGFVLEHDGLTVYYVEWRDAEASEPARGGTQRGRPAEKAAYAAIRVAEEAYIMAYLAASGYTLTVVLNFRDRQLIGFASGAKEWYPLRGTFKVLN